MNEIDPIQLINDLPREITSTIFNYYEGATKYRIFKTLEDYKNLACYLSLVVLPDGTLASGSDDYTIKIWDVKTGKRIKTLCGHTSWIRSLAVLSDGSLVSGSDDYTIKIWDVKTGKRIKTLNGHTRCIRSLVVLPDGTLASGSHDNTIKI